jgi:putative SOS response-associated peptidase YedK
MPASYPTNIVNQKKPLLGIPLDSISLGTTLDDGNWFYLAGIYRPATIDWPESYAILTIEANPDVARYQERQGAVLLRRQNMDWLDLTVPEADLLKPLPARSFEVEEIGGAKGKIGKPRQKLLAL